MDVSRAPSGASPLWIIALFITLSEATAGVASITTDGAARLIFAIFAVTFPVVVFVTFCWLLINYTVELYPPGEYSAAMTPSQYREGLRRGSRGISAATVDMLGAKLSVALAEQLEKIDATDSSAYERQQAVRVVFDETVEDTSIRVDIRAIVADAEEVVVPIDDSTNVSDLLDSVYFQLAPRVHAFEYLTSWMLINQDDRPLTDVGTAAAALRGQGRDTRLLAEVGVAAGDRLRVVALDGGSRHFASRRPRPIRRSA